MTQMTIGHLYTSLHAGCASAVARVLEAYEVEVEYVDLDPDDVEDALEQGEVDLLVSAWFPRDEHLAGPGLRVLGDPYQPVVSFAALTPLSAVGTLTATDVDRIIVADARRQALEEAPTPPPALSVLSLDSLPAGALPRRLRHARASG